MRGHDTEICNWAGLACRWITCHVPIFKAKLHVEHLFSKLIDRSVPVKCGGRDYSFPQSFALVERLAVITFKKGPADAYRDARALQ